MKKPNLRTALITGLLISLLTIGGIYAYLTYTQSITNTFTVGNVTATLTEPKWDAAVASNTDIHSAIYPGESFVKDPTITIGSSSNDAVIFMEVTYPVKDVITIGTGGAKNVSTSTQLFTPGSLASGWSELTAYEASATDTVTKVYALNKTLAAEESSTLFEEVSFANVAESQVTGSLDITVKADIIQADGMSIADASAITTEELSAIYDKYVAQNQTD